MSCLSRLTPLGIGVLQYACTRHTHGEMYMSKSLLPIALVCSFAACSDGTPSTAVHQDAANPGASGAATGGKYPAISSM